jgi:hypothetical protein
MGFWWAIGAVVQTSKQARQPATTQKSDLFLLLLFWLWIVVSRKKKKKKKLQTDDHHPCPSEEGTDNIPPFLWRVQQNFWDRVLMYESTKLS